MESIYIIKIQRSKKNLEWHYENKLFYSILLSFILKIYGKT